MLWRDGKQATEVSSRRGISENSNARETRREWTTN